MITVRDLATKLLAYSRSSPDAGHREVFIQFDGNVAFPFSHGTDNLALTNKGTQTFFVLRPDLKGARLVLERGDL